MNIACDNCKCNIFETILPMIFDDADFRVWSYNSKLKPEVVVIPVVKCIQCGTIKIPPTSMMGKSILDPEVKAYAQLIEDVKVYNTNIKTGLLIQNNWYSLCDEIDTMEERLKALEDKICGCAAKSIPKEVKVVKTTKRSGKNTKPTVQ